MFNFILKLVAKYYSTQDTLTVVGEWNLTFLRN